MIADTTVLVAPERYPVSLAEVKNHLRIEADHVVEDAYLTALMAMATEMAEATTGRSLITRTLRAAFDDWPRAKDWRGDYALELPYPPIQSVASLAYLDTDGVSQAVGVGTYRVDTGSGRIVLGYSQSWPTSYRIQSAGVIATYVAGYGDHQAAVPERIRHWILVRVATSYEHREAIITDGKSLSEVPLTFVDGLLDVYTIRTVV